MKRESDDSIIIEEMETNPERFYKNVHKLATIVMHQHYSYIRDENLKEDLVQEGILKAYYLCKNGDFDCKKSSLRNYLYTGMRNQMQNYVYKSTRDIIVDEVRGSEEDFDLEDTSEEDEEEVFEINEVVLYSVCDKFWFLGNYHNLVIDRLKKMGVQGDYVDLPIPDTVNELILDACLAEYIWRVRDES